MKTAGSGTSAEEYLQCTQIPYKLSDTHTIPMVLRGVIDT